MKPVRILHVIDGLKSGGAETFIMNIYRNIDRNNIQFDFLIRNQNGDVYSSEVKKLGGKIFFTAPFPRQPFNNFKDLIKFFKNNSDYRIMHVHANSLVYIIPLLFARINKFNKIVLHSHNTKSVNRISRFIHLINRLFINKIITDRFACSLEAGKWMFGKEKSMIINNAIDAKTFEYDINKRTNIKKQMGLDGKIIVGHVGRFVNQKNHIFVLRIFKEMVRNSERFVLLLVGDGPLKSKIEKEAEMLNIKKYILFTGIRDDVSDLFQIMDVFLFPSLYEGLPFTLIEAQASGLPCIISDTISNEAVITDLVVRLSLESSSQLWVNEIIKALNFDNKRTGKYKEIRKTKFDVKNNTEWIEKFYLS
ncbi:glycosyltransferase family 1 protein [Paenibacillus sp. FSL R7-0345]|uniref:glycosyltransferase family 1 protein n=1 Tax=Paenibacillus sp. FSL R7-0345 TaxID=2954535 RepID=UPI003159D0E3